MWFEFSYIGENYWNVSKLLYNVRTNKSLSVSDDVLLTIIDVDNDDFQMYMKCHKTNALLFEWA